MFHDPKYVIHKCQASLIPLQLQIRNEKARRYLSSMRKKQPVSFSERFPKADPAALKLMQRLLSFDPKDRPTAEEVNVST
jgi:serine/threonine protein kinase